MSKRGRRSDPQRQFQWQVRMRQWQASGQSVRDYCRTHALRESAFYFWRRKLARLDAACGQARESDRRRSAARNPHAQASVGQARRIARDRQSQARFLPIRVAPAAEPPSASGVEIVVGDRTIRVEPGFDRQTLADVLHVLESPALPVRPPETPPC